MIAQASVPALPGTLPSQGERRLIATGLAVIGLTFGGFGFWAAQAPLSSAVLVSGHVVVESERKVIQHLEGGIVKRILVKPGSIVAQGEPLLQLESVQADAAVSTTRGQRDAELARSARLAAERGFAGRIAFPAELTARAGLPSVTQVIAAEQKLFDTRRQSLVDQIALLRDENAQIGAEISSLETQVRSADSGVSNARQQLALTEQLVQDKFVSNARMLEFQGRVSDRELQRAQAGAAVAQARQKIKQNELRIETLRQEYVNGAADELRSSERRIDELRERLRPNEDALARLTIVAPIAGEVVDLKVHTVGGVVAPREPLMTIVPTGAPLVVKGKVRTEDITQLHPGAEVAIQLVAYKRRTTPVVMGRLTYVSADMLIEQTQAGAAPYYEVRISIERSALEAAGDFAIVPGMPVEAYVQSEARTLLEYLIQPLAQGMRRAGREN